mmetsp:Transcript_10725/g.15135  ORF Transcript_10725/g.15135 Transcript_10725/m.15135 type:complete len:411 (-) Transcript_10725:281-1513(-)|eukprot:CAMPEP_0171471340 /NCGR_PEP_ID=MMETSP0946-20130122/646_1 /TAXON_ID=109269 /ORGANISM="Vaucheria litorea, Strain CCMP2940" /LENGTH=410 /DNA_ID=CAMNT_0012000811 /DNA_START=97 /DNA_END=1329 /DNA_ORIENTATION=-
MPHIDHHHIGVKKIKRGMATDRNSNRISKASSPGIIEANRKTEICRNWEAGTCPYGDKCAFAHGSTELKIQSLNDMERAGRIPNAAKFRSYPCMTWVATGSCPYQSRCVFLHDPRLRSKNDNPSANEQSPAKSTEKQSANSSLLSTSTPDRNCDSDDSTSKSFNDHCSNSSGKDKVSMLSFPQMGMSTSSDSKDFFFWPHVQREICDNLMMEYVSMNELPPCEATYELSSQMAESRKIGDSVAAAVYHLWYSLVETVLSEKGISIETAANGEQAVSPVHLPIFKILASGKKPATFEKTGNNPSSYRTEHSHYYNNKTTSGKVFRKIVSTNNEEKLRYDSLVDEQMSQRLSTDSSAWGIVSPNNVFRISDHQKEMNKELDPCGNGLIPSKIQIIRNNGSKMSTSVDCGPFR